MAKRKVLEVGDYPGLSLWSLLFFVYLYAPMVVLVVYSFNVSRRAQIWKGFSFDWYVKAFSNDGIQSAALNSLIVAVIATIFATAIATLAALALSRGRSFKGQAVATGIITLPLVVPEIATAVATLSFFAVIGFQLGLTSIILAHTVFCIPFAFLPIRARLQGMDDTFEQAASDLYANDWQTFRYVTLPLLMPGVVAGAMLSFIISIDDFIITLMVAGAGSTTLPLYIYGMIRQGITPEVNVISTVMLSLSVLFITVYWFFSKKAEESV
ncbi:MAG: spermidine/putrescine transport system permease protein [Parasphingorhabdus sp.]|jgi:spermidine/putrescine transport system permease protein